VSPNDGLMTIDLTAGLRAPGGRQGATLFTMVNEPHGRGVAAALQGAMARG
jgi:hypothetical protein